MTNDKGQCTAGANALFRERRGKKECAVFPVGGDIDSEANEGSADGYRVIAGICREFL